MLLNPSRKYMRPRRRKAKDVFTSYFEERKACGYLLNLISSRFLNDESDTIFCFACRVLGRKPIVDLIKERCPEIAEDKRFSRRLEDEELGEYIEPRVLKSILKGEITAMLEKRLEKLSNCHDHEIEERFLALKNTFSLTAEELEIISYCYLEETSGLLNDHLFTTIGFDNLSMFRNQGHLLLGLKRSAFADAFAKGNLFKAEVMKKDRSNSLCLTSWCLDYLSGLSDIDLVHEFFTKENDETLTVSDFNIPEDDMMVLDTLLKSKGRQNILFYGAPGAGKTSFARSLAKVYGRELITVKTPETDEHKDRLRAIFATVNLADRDNSIVLVDEADEVINSYKSLFFESKTNKSWINQFLESHDKKVVWITNRSSEVDASTMRRFSYSMEFKKPDKKNRLKVLKYELEKKGIRDFFSDKEIEEICKAYNVDAGGIVNAISALQIENDTDKEVALRKVKAVLKSHEKATGGKKGGNKKEREFGAYSLEGLNTSMNIKDVVSALQGYERQPHTKNLSMALLLYGMPGTGKSEFVYYAGNALGKEVLLKRSSDIQSMWVGETEKNIARAFEEAQESGSILFFDEADTFLFPRKSAVRSWEISHTNEILTQLESFKGIVFFATNDMDGLDHAALRRFKFKIEFRPLTPQGNLRFYNTLLKGLVLESKLSEEEIRSINGIKNLTPGDFAVVKDQALFVEPSAITHRMLIEGLGNEVKYKKGAKGMGF